MLKCAISLTLNEGLVAQAKTYTNNLSATALQAGYVAALQHHTARQQQADNCAADWNTAHAAIGSFADEHSTL